MPLILPGNVASATASTTYDVANSCRFNQPDSAKMSITPASDGNKRTWTWSAWIKIGKPGNFGGIFFAGIAGATDNITDIYLDDDGLLYLRDIVSNGVLEYYVSPNRVFRDHSAWYHIVYAVDTTQGTDTNRVKLYINGTQETSLAENTYPDQNYETNINDSSYAHDLGHGLKTNGNSYYFDGYMAEVCFIDGTQYAASDFGEFDEDSPTIWKPKDPSGLTFGTNGFYLDFEASDNLGNDANGGTDLTETNLAATDQATDTPTNNFCTMNPLDNYYGAGTFSEGNLKIVTLSSDYTYYTGTIGLTAGLWYFEAKLTETADDNQVHVGIAGRVTTNSQHELGHYNDTYAYYSADGDSRTNDGDTSYGDGFDTGDILGVYIDLNANKLYFAKNGTVQNSGTGISITDPASVTAGAYFPAVGDWANQSCTWEVNFGNPSWSLSSAVADKNGYGSFEYDPSDGGGSSFDSSAKDFLAICTKNLGSDGG